MSVPALEINHTITLAELLHGFADAPDVPVTGIASDSRQLGEGFLFLACEGVGSHGLDYLAEAKAAGACAVAWDESTGELPGDTDLLTIAVPDLGNRLGELANRFYGSPSKTLKAIGVTGTNGKTTVAWLLSQCLQQLDKRCAYVGTLGHGVDELVAEGGMTTPAAIELHGRLAEFVDAGADHVALEVSSHALDQRRIDGMEFDAVLFTNLTRDHLDYHGDMQNYFEAKAQLFLNYSARHKIINLDSEFGGELASRCGQDVVTVSTNFDRVANGRPYVFVRSVIATEAGSEISITSSWGDRTFMLPLPGDFNVANAAIVLAYLLVSEIPLDQACDVMELVAAPPGRMQRIRAESATIYIDYAHTPNAIESALRALRPHCRGELWCVFGCGGDRDAGKRPLMARLAQKYSDHVVVTSDNPRFEQPQDIIDEILTGLDDKNDAVVIEDRATAIAWTLANTKPGDVVLIAGKGHEDYQEVAGERLPFSDYALASAASGLEVGNE